MANLHGPSDHPRYPRQGSVQRFFSKRCPGDQFERHMRACRQFAISKVAYGWIARAPPLTLCVQSWSCVHVGSRRIRSASVWLRAACISMCCLRLSWLVSCLACAAGVSELGALGVALLLMLCMLGCCPGGPGHLIGSGRMT